MKRIFALFLTLVMVMGMTVLPTSAVTAVTEDTQVCPHCNTPWEDCNWTPWVAEDSETSVPSGHFYLDEPLDMTARYMIGTADGQSETLAVDVCIDLRGFSMTQTVSNTRAFYVYDHCTLGILDTAGGGSVVGTGKSIKGGTIYVGANATVQLHSGTLSNAQKNRTADGGIVYVAAGGSFRMEDGIVDASDVTMKSGNKQYGTAFTVEGELDISGGMVLGGSAYQGGTINVTADGELNISGGTILGGTASSSGGCILNLGTTRISGGLITGGVSGARGGNIYTTGTAAQMYISGGLIENGIAENAGGNIAAYGGVFEVSGGKIMGDVYVSTNMTLTGSPCIAQQDYKGMGVVAGKLLTIRDLNPDAKVIFYGDGVMTEAAASPDVAVYLEAGLLIPASRYDLKVTDGVLVGSIDNTGYCPHCGQEVTWAKYTADTATSGHYYTPKTIELPEGSAGLTIAAGTDIVLNLISGGTKPAVPYQVAGTMSILSTVSSVKRISTGAATTDANGGTLQVTGTLNLYGGVLGPAANTDTVTTGNGGVVYVDQGNMNIYGGCISGASAARGGAVALMGVKGSRSQLNMYSGMILNGTATTGGGNIVMEYTNTTIHGGLILNGKSKNGGSIYNDGGTSSSLTINGGIIANGVATGNGGLLYHSATNCSTTINNGLLYGGEATEGGNGYINNGTLRMYGGKILCGVATTDNGGNLRAHAGYYYINKGEDANKNYIAIGDNNTTDDIPAPEVSGGTAASKGGNILLTGHLKLGKCQISGGTAAVAGSDIHVGPKAYLTVEPAFDGTLTMSMDDARITQLEEIRQLENTVCTALNGKLYVENYDMAMLIQNSSNTLALAGASLVDNATGEQVWFAKAQEAVDACGGSEYVRLYAPENTITMEKNLVVDLNGTTLNATGSGILFGMDRANDTYETYGTAVVSGPQVAPACQGSSGNRYIAVTENGVTSFHRLGIAINYVALRPSVSGVYYQGTWEFDEVLKEKVRTFGIALSTRNMPTADYATDADTLCTALQGAEMGDSRTVNSVLVSNILKPGADNETRAQEKIYAVPYILLDDGTEEGMSLLGSGVDYSLQWVVKSVDRYWPRCNDSQKEAVKALYQENTDTMAPWGLCNVEAYIAGTPSVRPLKVLSIGNSTDVDALHMLNLVAAAQGYDQEMIVGVLYYSGCELEKHVNFLQNNTDAYALYISSTLTPDAPPARYAGYTMYDALKYEDWDIIFIHEEDHESTMESSFTNGNIQILQSYIDQHKLNPEAIIGWHIPWVCVTDPDLLATYPKTPNGYVNMLAKFDNDRMKFYNTILRNMEKYVMPDQSITYIVPAGTALTNAVTSYMEETDLHRDYYHASDLGRVIVAYTWYCTLANIDRLDSVELDAIPKAFLRSAADKTQDRVLTEAEKVIILESVNNALADPLTVTQSQFTIAP